MSKKKAWFGALSGAGVYKARAVTFDRGGSDYLYKTSDFSGNADSGNAVFSGWVNFADSGSERTLFRFGESGTIAQYGEIYRTYSGAIEMRVLDMAGNTQLRITGTTPITSAMGWTHILISWNKTGFTKQLYIDDVSDSPKISGGGSNADWTKPYHLFGGERVSGVNYANLSADVADIYFNNEVYIDFSSSANRRKFISSLGKPVFLGPDGSIPTGSPPRVFLSLAKGAAVSSFATNKGNGGGFTINGILTEAGTSPSD